MLRQQVEDKKREKEVNKRKEDATKKKEYDEYMRDHYRGQASSPSPRGGKDNSTKRYGNDQEPERARESNGRQKAGGRGGDGDDGYRGGGVGRRGDDSSDGERGNKRRVQDDDDLDDRGAVGRRDQGGREKGGKRGQGRDTEKGGKGERDGRGSRATDGAGGRNSDDWVSREEFNDLQDLCKRLMDRQVELVDEVTQQADIIEDLRAALADAGSQVSSRSPRPVHGRERQGAGGRGNKVGAGPTKASAASVRGAKKENAAGSLAFGRRQVAAGQESTPEGLRSQSVHAKVAGKERIKAGGLKLPAVDRRPASMHTGAPQTKAAGAGRGAASRRLKGDDIAAAAVVKAKGKGSTHQPEEGGNGFMKLAAMANKKKGPAGGPVVVTYDEEPDAGYGVRGSPATIHKGGGGGGLRDSNRELRGASEHFKVGGVDADGISEDQLDRLLNRARGARN